MNEKELKSLKRIDLLEMLLESGRQIEELKARLAEAEQQLEDRDIKIQKAGSIADAALALNEVFEAAEAAAEQYLSSIKAHSAGQAGEADAGSATSQAARIIADAQAEADRILAEANAKKEKTYKYCIALVKKAKDESDKYMAKAAKERELL